MEIFGIGQTAYTRGSPKEAEDLIVEASLNACRDAGLEPHRIDGIIMAGTLGRAEDVSSALNLPNVGWTSRSELGGASPVACLGQAAAALDAGAVNVVLLATARLGYSDLRLGSGDSSVAHRVASLLPAPWIRRNLEQPYGLIVPMQHYALQATAWAHEFGVQPGSFAEVAMTMRAHALENSDAFMKDAGALTKPKYLESPFVSEPFRLLDCSLETDGAAALLVATDGRGPAGRPRVHVDSVQEGHPSSPDDIASRRDIWEIGLTKARTAFEEAGRGPEDVDFAQLYDCFTYVVLRQLEELGFCERGESPEFIERIGIRANTGKLPINTHGGLLSQAHVLGMNHILEAVRQIRGEAAIQLKRTETGIVTGYGDFGDGALAILTKRL